jgi:DNA-binding NarL/FixJ family response regulator
MLKIAEATTKIHVGMALRTLAARNRTEAAFKIATETHWLNGTDDDVNDPVR